MSEFDFMSGWAPYVWPTTEGRIMTQGEFEQLILKQMRMDAILFSKHPEMPGFTEAEKKELRK